MPDIVIAAYRPKPGKDAALRELLHDHVPFLRREGLVTDRIPILGRAKDGTYVEVFEWAEACDYEALKDLAETQGLFAGFEPISL